MAHLELGDHGSLEVEAGAFPEKQSLREVLFVERLEHVLALQVSVLTLNRDIMYLYFGITHIIYTTKSRFITMTQDGNTPSTTVTPVLS